jgi:hypothetical protein
MLNFALKDSPKLRWVFKTGAGRPSSILALTASIDFEVLSIGLRGFCILDIPSASGSGMATSCFASSLFLRNNELKLGLFLSDLLMTGGSTYGLLRNAPPSEGSGFFGPFPLEAGSGIDDGASFLGDMYPREDGAGGGFFGAFGPSGEGSGFFRPRESGGGMDGLSMCAS